jgi:hypothetical protein
VIASIPPLPKGRWRRVFEGAISVMFIHFEIYDRHTYAGQIPTSTAIRTTSTVFCSVYRDSLTVLRLTGFP